MSTHFTSFDDHRQLGNSATDAIARFPGHLAALFLLAEFSLRRTLPGSRKNAHSHLSN